MWSKTKPTVEGAYYVRGFNLFQSIQYEALVQVRPHHFDGEPAPELVCNIHESTSNADIDDWAPMVNMSDDFEWLGPLYAAPVAAAPEINLLCQAAAALREYRSCQGNGWPPAGFDAHVADLLSRIDASPEGCSTIAASDLVDTILNCQPLVHINSSTRLWEVLHAAGLSVSDQPKFFEILLAARTDA